MTLQQTLDELKQGAMERIPAEKLSVLLKATEELSQSGIVEKVIQPGTSLPAFALPNQNGEVIRSEDLLAQGAVVLTVFRGHW